MIIILNKSKALILTTARLKDPLNYFLGDQKILEACCCKYLRIIVRKDLRWADQVSLEDTTFRNAYYKEGN